MALQRTRHASIFVGSRKIGEMFKNKVSFNPGDEPLFGDSGWEGMSDGATTTTVDFDAFVPTAGATYDVRPVLLGKLDVDVTIGLIGGKTHQQTMRFTKAEYESDAKTGQLNGSFTLMGGVPDIS